MVIGKEVVVTESKYYPGIFLEGIWKTRTASLRTVSVPRGIRTKYLPYTNADRHRHVNPEGFFVIN
jgi:hypothetical protein